MQKESYWSGVKMLFTRAAVMMIMWSMSSAVATAQNDAGGLPIDALIQVDRQLIRVERLIEQEDYETAFDIIEEIVELYEEHNVEKPPELEYRYAQVAARTGSFQAALDAVDRYLAATGRDGEFYRDVLELLDRIEQKQTMDLCTEESGGVPCWKALVGPPRCAIWEVSHIPLRPATWSGPCAFGRAHGDGTLTWTDAGAEGNSNGQFQDGKKQGPWFERFPDGNTETGPYVDGVRDGQWTLTTADGGNNDGRIRQVRYVNGELDGLSEISWPGGQTLHLTFAGGILSGPSVRRYTNGDRIEGQFVNGLREGEWNGIAASGTVWFTETFAAGTMHGPWSRVHALSAPGCRSRGNYVDGNKEGRWTECEDSPSHYARPESQKLITRDLLWTGNYVDGVKHGPWKGHLYESISYTRMVRRLPNVEESFVRAGRIEGVFDNGKESGYFTTARERYNNPNMRRMADGCYEGSKVPFVGGQRHGTGWRIVDTYHDCDCMKITWENGEEVERDEVRGRTCRREIFEQ